MQAPIVSVPVSNPPFFDDNPFFLHAPKNTPQMGYTGRAENSNFAM
jgi:hypothetical protein